MFKIILHFFTLYLCFYSVFKKRNWVWMPGVWAHPCIKSGPLAEVQWVSAAWVCMHARGASVEMTLAGSVKVCLTGAATESALFFLPPRPPTVQSIQLLSPQGSRQSIKASGCILLTCAAPLMNSQHDPGWQAGNGCNKDCFCMLFASLINHLAVQQIREPHGNLISHGKGEAEESSGGKRAESGRATLFYSPPPPFFFFFFSSGTVEQGVWELKGRALFEVCRLFLNHQCSVNMPLCPQVYKQKQTARTDVQMS